MYHFTSKSFKKTSNSKDKYGAPKPISASYKCECDNTIKIKEGSAHEKH